MEKKLLKNKLVFIFLIFSFFSVYAQSPSVVEHIRIPMWADLDAYPGSIEATEDAVDISGSQFDFPVKRIKEVAPFIISGMVYGWTFTYTPSDISRGVEEFFEIKEIHPFDMEIGKIVYSSSWISEGRLNCWCEYTRNEFEIQTYQLWSTIQNPVIHGVGLGKLDKGYDGIRDACEDALKNAVREHYRTIIKNKPKEITGSVLIRDVPTIGIKAGQYIINLDFFLEYGRIKEYKLY